MNFTFPAFVDQGCKETFESGKPEEKAREGNEGVSCSLHRLIVEEPTGRRERDIVKVLHSAIIGCIPPVAVSRNTPSEVKVSAHVKEGGSKTKEEYVEEPAQ